MTAVSLFFLKNVDKGVFWSKPEKRGLEHRPPKKKVLVIVSLWTEIRFLDKYLNILELVIKRYVLYLIRDLGYKANGYVISFLL